MIAKQSLLNILAAADKADADDVAIREALYVALRGSDESFAGSATRETPGMRTACDPRQPVPRLFALHCLANGDHVASALTERTARTTTTVQKNIFFARCSTARCSTALKSFRVEHIMTGIARHRDDLMHNDDLLAVEAFQTCPEGGFRQGFPHWAWQLPQACQTGASHCRHLCRPDCGRR
jgi:hypothetical protein